MQYNTTLITNTADMVTSCAISSKYYYFYRAANTINYFCHLLSYSHGFVLDEHEKCSNTGALHFILLIKRSWKGYLGTEDRGISSTDHFKWSGAACTHQVNWTLLRTPQFSHQKTTVKNIPRSRQLTNCKHRAFAHRYFLFSTCDC